MVKLIKLRRMTWPLRVSGSSPVKWDDANLADVSTLPIAFDIHCSSTVNSVLHNPPGLSAQPQPTYKYLKLRSPGNGFHPESTSGGAVLVHYLYFLLEFPSGIECWLSGTVTCLITFLLSPTFTSLPISPLPYSYYLLNFLPSNSCLKVRFENNKDRFFSIKGPTGIKSERWVKSE